MRILLARVESVLMQRISDAAFNRMRIANERLHMLRHPEYRGAFNQFGVAYP